MGEVPLYPCSAQMVSRAYGVMVEGNESGMSRSRTPCHTVDFEGFVASKFRGLCDQSRQMEGAGERVFVNACPGGATGVPHLQENAPPYDTTAGLCLGF